MTNTANSRRKIQMPKDIRKKFAAALCMLLIAAIMMVGSTYAWFTLSTAPEVTGITTNIGANGNLEIALLNNRSFMDTTDNLGILSDIGDSMAKEGKDVKESNETWGNLVDLSDLSYGLKNMILNPAAMNLSGAGTLASGNENSDVGITGGLNTLLLAPNYGSDGRVINVQKATTVGKYDGSAFKAIGDNEYFGGVRVVGVSSGVTFRVSSYRSATAGVITYINSAKTYAQKSLVDNGQQLANMVLASVQDPNYALTQEDVNALNAVITNLGKSINSIGNAIKSVALAYALSSANSAELTDTDVRTLIENVDGLTTITDNSLSGELGVTIDATATPAIHKAIEEYNALKTAFSNAQDGIGSLTVGSTYSQAETSGVGDLLDKEYLTVNGVRNPGTADVGTVASNLIAQNQIVVEMNPGSGIYADIAALVGDYTASGLTLTAEFNGIAVEDLPATMVTKVIGYVAPTVEDEETHEVTKVGEDGPTVAYVTSASREGAAGDPVSGGTLTVDDPYGYIIDFGVRTNAAGSNLLLDVDGSQRVYDEENFDNESTQGGGSYLQFSTADVDLFSLEDVKALMSAVRVVFVSPNNDNSGYEVLGVAAPDIKVGTDDVSGARTVTAGDTVSVIGEDTVKAKLVLFNSTVTEIVANKEYSVTLTTKKTTTDENDQTVADNTLCALQQNKAKKVSALVYLDGDYVDNTMVANAKTSMSGKLNIQFKSSAELKPMDVRSMREASESGNQNQNTPTIPDNVTFAQFTTALGKVTSSSTYTTAVAAENKTEAQTNLISAVNTANEVTEVADKNYKTELTALAGAFVNAGGTLADLLS